MASQGEMWREVPTRVVEAGCEVLYERIAEAYEPEWREIVMRIFDAMQNAYAIMPSKDK